MGFINQLITGGHHPAGPVLERSDLFGQLIQAATAIQTLQDMRNIDHLTYAANGCRAGAGKDAKQKKKR